MLDKKKERRSDIAIQCKTKNKNGEKSDKEIPKKDDTVGNAGRVVHTATSSSGRTRRVARV